LEMSRGEVVDALLRSGCLLRGSFRLSSGGVSSFYVDVRRVYSHPKEAKLIVSELARIAAELGCDVIAGVETGGIPLATMVAFILEKPLIYVRKKPKEHGTQKLIEGDASVRGLALIIDDVATTGSSLARAVNVLREAGYRVENALVVVDRQEGAARNLADIGVTLHALASLQDLLAAQERGEL